MKKTHIQSKNMKKSDILLDYTYGCVSREVSLLGRKEVFAGRAKFGIFGDGKELPQLAMARAFQVGDYRAGYYRDQTFMFAIGALHPRQFFAQLYAHASVEADPASAGRMMTAHFATPFLDKEGRWLPLLQKKNVTADLSPTASQMPRLLGLAYASKLYRENPVLHQETCFSHQGNEVAWGTIGDASTSEGIFFESCNAAGVLQVPMIVSVWDDGYGISVPASYHTIKQSISKAMQGFKRSKQDPGYEIWEVKGWDYPKLMEAYHKASELARREHCPVLLHITELTQPQGHSTSGSHTRYKSEERLKWEETHDGLRHMRSWIEQENIATPEALNEIEQRAREEARQARDQAWQAYIEEIKASKKELITCLQSPHLQSFADSLQSNTHTLRSELISVAKQAVFLLVSKKEAPPASLKNWLAAQQHLVQQLYHSHTYSHEGSYPEEAPKYTSQSPLVDGSEVVRTCFNEILAREPKFFAIGEDVGYIGDVNQGFAGLQKKHGYWRVTDTGIREATIIGQGIGAAMRGLRPLVEIQYLDYMLYALQVLSDDVATLHYRSAGQQKAPLIVRTRGHRLEGIWHSGSPMGTLLHALRGMYILVPRNMTQAAGFYNTLLTIEQPALVVECLNGYRLKEKMPENISTMRLALGKAEILRAGKDLTVVTYGSMCRIACAAADIMKQVEAEIEVIDLQTLIPFDLDHLIADSLARTNRLLIIDEDVPGGASAYILQQILAQHKNFWQLDTPPVVLSAKAHRPAYGSDGDYFSKPNQEQCVEAMYNFFHEHHPQKYPPLETQSLA